MSFYYTLGKIPSKRHTIFRKPNGELYAEELVSTHGFSSTYSLVYHCYPPTLVKQINEPYSVEPKIAREKHLKHLNHVFTLEGAVSFVRLVIYIVAFVFLSLHLQHGFSSAFQSMGAKHSKYTPAVVAFGKWYSILIPAGFIIIAVYHFFVK